LQCGKEEDTQFTQFILSHAPAMHFYDNMDFYGFAEPHEGFSVVQSWRVWFFTHL
jgi:hypothetical protein